MSRFIDAECSDDAPVCPVVVPSRGVKRKRSKRKQKKGSVIPPDAGQDPEKQHRGFAWTLFNYTDADIALLKLLDYRYLCFGKEVCPTTDRPHLQGFIYFTNPKKWKQVRALLPSQTSQIDQIFRTPETNRSYCKKCRRSGTTIDPPELENVGDNWFEDGDLPVSQAEKGRMEIARYDEARRLALLRQYDEIPSDIYIRHNAALRNLAAQRDEDFRPVLKDLDSVCGLWFYGTRDSGKSREARIRYPGIFEKCCDSKFFMDYDPMNPGHQRAVLFEDFDKANKSLKQIIKRATDKYPFKVDVKFGSKGLTIRPEVVIVTSNFKIEQIWGDEEDLEAILKRFRVVRFHVQEKDPFTKEWLEAPIYTQHPEPTERQEWQDRRAALRITDGILSGQHEVDDSILDLELPVLEL